MIDSLPQQLTISVTQEDINNGQPGEARHCPIALAINRCLPAACMAGVSIDRVAVYSKDRWLYDLLCQYRLPDAAIEWQRHFDEVIIPVQPAEFTLTKQPLRPITWGTPTLEQEP